MNAKKLTLSLFVVALGFLALGDRILPSPASSYSLNARTSINNFLVGLLPQFKQQKPYSPTENAVEGLNP
jgi:hypothetical protein